jgi:excisionase family DNA binding protein
MADSVMKVAEVAKRLKCSKDKVTQLIQTGRLKAIDLGCETRHSYRVTEQQLDSFIGTPAPTRQSLQIPHEGNDLVIGSFMERRRKSP